MKKKIKSMGSDSICGGVVSQTIFKKDPEAYMMCYYMEDEWFEVWKILKSGKHDKEAKTIFENHAISAI